jgi:hypothetical protein
MIDNWKLVMGVLSYMGGIVFIWWRQWSKLIWIEVFWAVSEKPVGFHTFVWGQPKEINGIDPESWKNDRKMFSTLTRDLKKNIGTPHPSRRSLHWMPQEQ